ncbi:MAG: GNAT family N-acetyltransferase [Candidatus Saccharimonas sp.]
MRWCGDVFGNSAIELAGRVVHPDHQSQGIATELLKQLVEQESPKYLTTYTRNPSILRMIARVSECLYPVEQDSTLQAIAGQLPHASELDAAHYHLNRYGEAGLFRGNDPADRPYGADDISLKQQFEYLHNIRNALVVVARVRRNT